MLLDAVSTMVDLYVEGSVTPPDIKPAISPSVHLSLTVVYTCLYGILFLIVYVQLWMILCYRHRRLSYQTVFLFLCLLWAGLRTTLFSFYFRNCLLANTLSVLPYWLLYCFPVCLQFTTLCLLVLFFAQVAYKAKNESRRYKWALWLGLGFTAVLFLGTNLACAIVTKENEKNSSDPPLAVSMVRVVINDGLFLFGGVSLSYLLYKVSKMSAVNLVLEARGTSKCQALTASVLITFLYSSRAVYNMIAIAKPTLLSFGYGWINVSDQADNYDLSDGFAYISFGVVLFVWEFLPTFIVVLFFRVTRPTSADEQQALEGIRASKASPRAYFFDNPRRYDSDDDLSGSRSFNSRNSLTGYEGGHVGQTCGSYASNHSLPYSAPSNIFTTGLLHHVPPPAINQSEFYDGT